MRKNYQNNVFVTCYKLLWIMSAQKKVEISDKQFYMRPFSTKTGLCDQQIRFLSVSNLLPSTKRGIEKNQLSGQSPNKLYHKHQLLEETGLL